MEDQGSTASTYECFRTPTLREIWKRYKSFATRCYYQHNTKNIKESPDVHVTATQEKKHATKRDRRRHPKVLDDRSNDHHEKVKIRGDNQETCCYNYYSDPTLINNDGILHEGVETFSCRRQHEDGHQRGCFKALLGTTTRSKYGEGPQQPQGPATIPGSTPTPGSNVEGSMEREEMARASTVERKTTKSMGRTQSKSAAQWTAKRARSERRATSVIRRASSAIGAEGRPQRRSSFNGRMVSSNGGGGGRSDEWGSSSTSMIYGRSSSICSNSSGHHHHVIMSSSSSGLLKPPSIEQALECTIEELCFGCVKKMGVTRDVISSNGQIRKEDEVLKINVKSGWKGGTKITFPGVLSVMNRPGDYAADVVFTVIQMPHPVFTSEDDDLIMDIGIPLANALTGCTLNIPLLGGGDHGNMSMDIDIEHVVYPGFEKIIPGQGMPDKKQPQCRGDLRIRFHVQFPNMLTHAQRSEIFNILNTVN